MANRKRDNVTGFNYPEPVSELLTMGDCRGMREWPDYLELGLGPEHIPDLIRMALDEDLNWADSDSLEVWAPVHAWRALAQLGAEEAIEPLTRLLPRIDEYDDDWVGEELPDVFGLIGPAAVPTLRDYLADASHGLWARVAAAHSLGTIGERHPQARSECVESLTATLRRFAEHDRTLNAFIISYLVDLKAVEAASLMERAFNADCVDLSVEGDWQDVQVRLGLIHERISPPEYDFLEEIFGPAPAPQEEPQHATSRYMCVTLGVIDKLQEDYFAGRDLGRSIPGMDATTSAVIVAESLQADRLWDTLPEILAQPSSAKPLREPLSDWSRATLAELFFGVSDVAREIGDEAQTRDYWALAWAMLEEALSSPTASPMLWYQDIFFEMGQELRRLGDREAIEFVKRGLAHDLRHHEGMNARSFLLDLAETHLWLDDLHTGLTLLAALLRNDPADIWTYNLMAITFDRFGLTELGTEAARRGLEWIEATGDPEELRDQLLQSLEDMEQSERRGREAEVDPTVLTDLRAAMALDFEAGEHRPVVGLCHELVPDLDQIPVKRPPEKPDLPPSHEFVQRREAPPAHRKLGRNDPCWCGSGKKYKYCHMRADQRRLRARRG
ncbi:MAG: SEC-C domain-containing protein [Chloroflexota bacterium]|nr:SEC-C domain-containing protein [Chloroflexota bacterium]